MQVRSTLCKIPFQDFGNTVNQNSQIYLPYGVYAVFYQGRDNTNGKHNETEKTFGMLESDMRYKQEEKVEQDQGF